YFLPRLLELSTTPEGEQHLGTSLFDIVAKLCYGRFESWPNEERSAMQAFLDAGFSAVLEQDPGHHSALDYLRDVAPIAEPVGRWLNEWDTRMDGNGVVQLAAAINQCWSEVAKSGRAWSGASPQAAAPSREVARWLFTKSHLELLESVALARL